MSHFLDRLTFFNRVVDKFADGHGIVTREDLAEQSVDDLGEISDLDPQRAGELILAARKHWFEQSQQV